MEALLAQKFHVWMPLSLKTRHKAFLHLNIDFSAYIMALQESINVPTVESGYQRCIMRILSQSLIDMVE